MGRPLSMSSEQRPLANIFLESQTPGTVLRLTFELFSYTGSFWESVHSLTDCVEVAIVENVNDYETFAQFKSSKSLFKSQKSADNKEFEAKAK